MICLVFDSGDRGKINILFLFHVIIFREVLFGALSA